MLKLELTYELKEKISSFYKQPNQLNDVIRKLHIVIDFVVSSGCSKETKIFDYAINILKMNNIEESNINKNVYLLISIYF
jgi:hypothetical protein